MEDGRLLESLQLAHADAAIIGGIASGGGAVLASRHHVERVSNGVVGLIFRGNVPLRSLICREGREGVEHRLGLVKATMDARREVCFPVACCFMKLTLPTLRQAKNGREPAAPAGIA